MKLPRNIIIHADPTMRPSNMAFVHSLLSQLPTDEAIEIKIQRPAESKSMQQLRTLFGLWFKWLVQEVPEYSQFEENRAKNELHRDMKQLYLVRIISENPSGYIQDMWVEKAAALGEGILSDVPEVAEAALDALKYHESKLSLSWADMNQTRAYMDAVYWHWQDKGYPPPVPDKFHKIYEAELQRGC